MNFSSMKILLIDNLSWPTVQRTLSNERQSGFASSRFFERKEQMKRMKLSLPKQL